MEKNIMEKNIMENEKKIYLLEIWSLSTNEWGDRTKNRRVLMHLVTLDDDNYNYKYQALTKIVKRMSGSNAYTSAYEVSAWIDDETDSMFLMSDWGSSFEKGNQWYGVQAILTPMKKVTEI